MLMNTKNKKREEKKTQRTTTKKREWRKQAEDKQLNVDEGRAIKIKAIVCVCGCWVGVVVAYSMAI